MRTNYTYVRKFQGFLPGPTFIPVSRVGRAFGDMGAASRCSTYGIILLVNLSKRARRTLSGDKAN